MAEYIERERTVELLRGIGNREYRKEKGTIQDAIKMISYSEYTSAADVAPVVHGRWISKNTHGYEWTFVCSNCGYVDGFPFNDRYNYFPNCGARMDETVEEDK